MKLYDGLILVHRSPYSVVIGRGEPDSDMDTRWDSFVWELNLIDESKDGYYPMLEGFAYVYAKASHDAICLTPMPSSGFEFSEDEINALIREINEVARQVVEYGEVDASLNYDYGDEN